MFDQGALRDELQSLKAEDLASMLSSAGEDILNGSKSRADQGGIERSRRDPGSGGRPDRKIGRRSSGRAFTLGVIVKHVRALRRTDSELRRVRDLDVMIERIAATHIRLPQVGDAEVAADSRPY